MNKRVKIVALLSSILMVMSIMTGCKSFNKPLIETIQPNETAFLIPLTGQTTDQNMFGSEELLAKSKVASKEIEIPKRWIKTGRTVLFVWETGEWRPNAKLIKIDRKAVSRNWTSGEGSGTSAKDESIKAETKESIAFSGNFNCTSQIDEINSVKFLYRYNNVPLETIMDTEIRTRLTTLFVEQSSKYTLEELLVNKQNIMDYIRKDMTTYFAERGITITALGIAGDLNYTNPQIQEAIDNKFKAQKSLETQKSENERLVSKAKAEAEAIQIQANTINAQIKLKEIEVQSKLADAEIKKAEAYKEWKSVQVVGGQNLMNLDLNKK